MALDERLRRELEQAGRPADPTGVYEHLIRRRERRRIARRLQVAGLALVVIAGSSLGFIMLSRVFGTQQRPAAGPSNGRIVFTSMEPELAIPEVTAAWYLSTIDPDGTDLSFVGPLAVDEALHPNFSPDGARIAFVGFTNPDRGPVGSIYVANADGSDLREVFRPENGEQVEAVVWSPDGTRIGYELAQGYEGGDETVLSWTIWTMTPDGDDRRHVTSTGREMHFSWSPDGARIVFERWSPIRERSDLGTAGSDLFVVDADGSNEMQVTSDAMSRDPAWSPDGTQIAFVHGPRGDQHVAVMEVDGSGIRELVGLPQWGVSIPYGNTITWSPDGTLIAFTGRTEDQDACHISTVDPVDGSVRTIVSMPASESCPGQYGMSWAPAIESPNPSASPTVDGSPSADPTPDESSSGEDIGLGFPVCRVSTIEGPFVDPNETATVFVATRTGDVGGCPDVREAFNLIALDVDADGIADTSYGPIECEMDCRTFSAPDLDGDGTAELLVVQTGGVVLGLGLFDVQFDEAGPALEPVIVAPPGDPAGGFDPGEDVRLWLGGDEFYLDTLECGDPQMRNGPGLVVTRAESLPHDSPDAEWHAHRVVFALVDGTLRVMDLGDFTEPTGTSFQSGETLCGSNLGP